LLPTAVSHIGQWLPPGAGASLLRSTAYFGGHGSDGHLAVLIVWILFGLAAIVAGHHAPFPFAARRSPGAAPGAEGAAAATGDWFTPAPPGPGLQAAPVPPPGEPHPAHARHAREH
jgi:hypothetical protein